MMDRDRVRPTINMDLVKNSNPKMEEAYLTDPSSNYLSAKRRKSKIYSTRKTNEQLIKESHQDLLRYIEGVDHRVHNIVQSQQAEFLVAYKKHIKKVREEMEEIRVQSLNNSNSQKAYVDKIDCLQKELIIFRDESLKLFDKIIVKDKEIFDLNIKIKELTANNQYYEKNVYFLTRRNKELQAFITKIKQRYGDNTLINEFGLVKREIRSQNKRYDMSTPNSQDLLPSHPHKQSEDLRPFTSAKTSNSFTLKLNSNKKQDQTFDIKRIKQKLEEQVGSKLVNIDTVIKIIDEKPDACNSKELSVNNSPMNHRIYSKQKRRSTYRIIQDEVIKLKSQEFAQKNQYLNIFKNCVQDVKRDIIKRNNIPSLNYFKENGPQNFIQFKKLDHYTILQMLLYNQSILTKIYDIIFQ